MNKHDTSSPKLDFGDLTPLLAPRTVAVVGASERAGNLGGVAVGLLKQFRFQGQVWPVNPNRDEVHGLRCFPSLADLPGVPDMVILAIPGPSAAGMIAECGRLGIPSAVLWAGGFAEGGGEGIALQEELAAAARKADVRLCGPNCLGIMNTATGLMATFGSMLSDIPELKTGSTSMVSQSGGMSGITSTLAQAQGFGFRVTVSCGNEAVLTLSDFVHALVADEGTRVIALYVEGLKDPEGFVTALEAARDAGKAVVIMKAGASEASGAAALAHTGKLAGSDRAFEAIFRETAAIRVWSVEEMLDTCLLLATQPEGVRPAGKRMATSTFGGGAGVLITDLAERAGLEVPELTERTRRELKDLVTPLAATRNPIDLTPQSMNDPKWRDLLPDALDRIVGDDNVDMFLFMSGGMSHRRDDVRRIVGGLRDRSEKPVVLSWMTPPPGMGDTMAGDGFVMFTEHARAVGGMARMAQRSALLDHPVRRSAEPPAPVDWGDYVPEGETVVPEPVVLRLLADQGFDVAAGELVRRPAEIRGALDRIGLPVAVKGIAEGMTHRAAAGLLALNIDSVAGVEDLAEEFRETATAAGARYEGTWIQRMAPSGFELIVTATRDRDMGILVGVGLGGGMTELLDDIVFARAPLDETSVRNLLPHLAFVRRRPETLSAAQRDRIATFVAAFSRVAAAAPWKRFSLEVNPVKLSDSAAVAVDGLLVIEER